MTAARRRSMVAALAMASICSSAAAQSYTRTSGFNLGLDPSEPMIVEFVSPGDGYMLQVDLIFDPAGPPMEKHFLSPTFTLDSMQPLPLPVWEDFLLVDGPPIRDWHEEILTEGWEWVLPDASVGSLITKDGNPWPWEPIPMPNDDPSKIWVKFPPIFPNEVLDVHKDLLWVGAPGNRLWGDGVLDDGTTFDESFIRVLEYPTVPEPSTIVLLGLVLLAMGAHARHRRGAWHIRSRDVDR